MTTEQLPTVDILDDETQRSPAWEDMKARQRKNGTLPRGTYDAEIRDVAIVRRRDDGSHVLRVIVRTVRLERDALAWQGLSSNPDDPFDLDERQVRALRKFADRLGFPTPCPAPMVVQALRALMGHGEVVQVKITQTPVGQQATLMRDAAAIPVTNGQPLLEVLDPETAAAAAHVAHGKVLDGLRAVRLGLACVAEGCYLLHRGEGWLALGFETLTEYLAAPEVTLSRSDFYRGVEIWQAYVLDGGVEPTLLEGAGPSKLEVPLPALTQGVVSAEQAVADATAMTRKELRLHYSEMLGSNGNGATAPDEVEHRPAGGTVDVAEFERLREENARLRQRVASSAPPAFVTVVAALRRVFDEIGDPSRKRMSRELREAVLAALAAAGEEASP